MTETIQLKSRALEVFDFRRVDISSFITGFVPSEDQLKKDLNRVLKRYGRREDVSRVSGGDTVVLSCYSEDPKYRKEDLTVIAGRGLFSRELENQLIGLEKEKEYVLSAGGTPVTLQISRITRTTLPELTDENAASFGMEGITCAADLRRWCIKRQVETFLLENEKADEAAAYVWQETAKRSRILRDPEELALVSAYADGKIRDLPPVEDADDIDMEQIRQIFISELDLAAVGEALMEQDGKCLTKEDYEAYISRLEEAYPDRTRAQLRERHSMFDYAREQYADYLAQRIDGYVSACFIDVLTRV